MTSPLPPGPERLRRFRDGRGVEWTAWEVDAPHIAESAQRLVYLDPALAEGWLAFESERGERSRLTPLPVGWHEGTEDQLLGLLERSAPVRAGRTSFGSPPGEQGRGGRSAG
jgi:hypothetical protein